MRNGASEDAWYWETVTRNLALIAEWGEDYSIRHLVMPNHVECRTFPVPTEADLDQCYGSKYLSAADLGDKKVRTRISKIRKEMLQQQGGKPERAKFVWYFATLEKPMVLNATNKNTLVEKLGKNPADWVNADVGILAENTTYGGKPTKGLRLVCGLIPLSKSATRTFVGAGWLLFARRRR